jgi:hypothetical protein
MVQVKRHASGHLGLQRIDDADDAARSADRHTYYTCRVCGTHWSHLSDKHDPRAGWNTLQPKAPRKFVPRHFR